MREVAHVSATPVRDGISMLAPDVVRVASSWHLCDDSGEPPADGGGIAENVPRNSPPEWASFDAFAASRLEIRISWRQPSILFCEEHWKVNYPESTSSVEPASRLEANLRIGPPSVVEQLFLHSIPNPPRGSFQSIFRYGHSSTHLVQSTQYSKETAVFPHPRCRCWPDRTSCTGTSIRSRSGPGRRGSRRS